MKIGLRCIFALLFYVFVWAHAATVPTGLHGGKEWMGLHDIRQEDTVKIVRDIIENKGQPISRSLFESAASQCH
jgi:hypothetical protein